MQIRHLLPVLLAASVIACASGDSAEYTDDAAAPADGGAASIQDDVSDPDIVKIAVGSPDHTTLVAALQAADLVNSQLDLQMVASSTQPLTGVNFVFNTIGAPAMGNVVALP